MPVNPIASTLQKRNVEKGIAKPHVNDVLLGRGKFVNNFEGNARFRSIVAKYKLDYVSCPKSEKPKYAKLVVNEIYNLKPPGRFLKQDATTKLWNTISSKKAIDKARQALREGAPDIIKGFSLFEQKSELLKDESLETYDTDPQIYPGTIGPLIETCPMFTSDRNNKNSVKTEEYIDIEELMDFPSLEQEDPADFFKTKPNYDNSEYKSNEMNLDLSKSGALYRRRRFVGSRDHHHFLKEAPEEQGRRFSWNTSSDLDALLSDLKAMTYSGIHDDSFTNIRRGSGICDKNILSNLRENLNSITDFLRDISDFSLS